MNVVYEPFPTVPLDKFYPELRFEFKDLPPQLFAYYIQRTAVDMAEKANLLRRWVRIELEPGVSRYALIPPDGLTLWAIMGVFHSTSCGCGVHRTPRFYGPPEGACPIHDSVWWEPQEQVLNYTGCHCGGCLYVNMSVVPDRDACELPKIYMDRFFTTLLMGTRAKILLITNREWTNLKVGAELNQEYERMLTQDAIRVAEKQQRGAIKMQFGRVM